MSGESSISMKSFVTQSEIDEKRKKRQEEWEQKRKPDDPLECPEEVVDNRSLFDRLQEQKDRKDQEYQEQFALKNSVKGLEDDEAQFLDFVSQRQMELNKARNSEEADVIKQMKESSVSLIEETKPKEDKKQIKVQIGASQGKKSQQALLAGVVKRKSTDSNTEIKKRKLSEEGSNSESKYQQVSMAAGNATLQTAKVIGVLPGLGAYDNDTSDSETSSSDSDIDFKIVPRRVQVTIEHQ